MKKILLLVFFCTASLGLAAQNIVSHTVSDFNQLSISGKMNVIIEQGDENKFEVSLTDVETDKFSWTLSDKKLVLKLKANTRKDAVVDVKVTYKSLNGIHVTTASVRAENETDSGIFNIKLNNGAHLNMTINAKDITMSSDGNSAATLAGETLYLNIHANARSKIDARALEARSAIVTSQFGSEIFVWGTERLEAKAANNSVVYYKGTPEIFKPGNNTLGSIEQFSY